MKNSDDMWVCQWDARHGPPVENPWEMGGLPLRTKPLKIAGALELTHISWYHGDMLRISEDLMSHIGIQKGYDLTATSPP